MKTRIGLIILLAVLFVFQSFQAAVSGVGLIASVKLDKHVFAPETGDVVTIKFMLERDARVTLKLFDLDNNLVATLLENEQRSRGLNSVLWNGRDQMGETVPDTAYYFTVEAVDQAQVSETYNPTTHSGGQAIKARLIGSDQGIAYELSDASMVRIRIGVHNGPLLKTLVDWEPRLAGDNFEPWNGMDDSNILNVRAMEYTLDIQAFTLPENAIIAEGSGVSLGEAIIGTTSGSNAERSRIVLERKQRERLLVKKSGKDLSTRKNIHNHYSMNRATDRAPKFRVRVEPSALPQRTGSVSPPPPPGGDSTGAPEVVSGLVEMTLDLEELSGIILSNTRYEVITYIDNEFYMEDEQGYHPYTFPLDTTNLANGSHTITFNVATLTDQVGSASIQIYVQN